MKWSNVEESGEACLLNQTHAHRKHDTQKGERKDLGLITHLGTPHFPRNITSNCNLRIACHWANEMSVEAGIKCTMWIFVMQSHLQVISNRWFWQLRVFPLSYSLFRFPRHLCAHNGPFFLYVGTKVKAFRGRPMTLRKAESRSQLILSIKSKQHLNVNSVNQRQQQNKKIKHQTA